MSNARPRLLSLWVSQMVRIGHNHEAWVTLLGLAGFQALVTSAVVMLLAPYLPADSNQSGELVAGLLVVGAGIVAGCALAGWQRHPVRNRGLVPFGALGLLAALGWCALAVGIDTNLPLVPTFLLGFAGALITVPLCSAYLTAVSADGHVNRVVLLLAANCFAAGLLALSLFALIWGNVLPTPFWQFGFLAVLALLGAAVAVGVLFREMVENVLECLVWPVYRIQAHGPGADMMPLRGPLLVVSNHTSYADPFLLGKVVPRSLVPMMTSVFYDLPFIHWWMVHVVHTIRVEAAAFRREAPELREAIERLRRGECLVIFPEARLRSREDVLLRPFGQGVWHILREVPETVVAPCWIEGGWGSWSSYFKGPPMKNKRFDVWRRIDIGIGEPAPLLAEVLKDHRRTREYLHAACLACRQYVGLPPPSPGGKGDEPSAKQAP